jgi:hypothetical protein
VAAANRDSESRRHRSTDTPLPPSRVASDATSYVEGTARDAKRPLGALSISFISESIEVICPAAHALPTDRDPGAPALLSERERRGPRTDLLSTPHAGTAQMRTILPKFLSCG